jgi:hypothetical protein
MDTGRKGLKETANDLSRTAETWKVRNHVKAKYRIFRPPANQCIGTVLNKCVGDVAGKARCCKGNRPKSAMILAK